MRGIFFPKTIARPRLLAVLGIAGLAASHGLVDRDSPIGYALLLTAIPLCCSLTLPWFNQMEDRGGLLPAVIERISIWSYSIYLCHMLIYNGGKPLVGYDSLSTGGKLAYKLASLAVIILVSALNYRWFEKPLMDLRDRHRAAPPSIGASA